MTTRSSTWRTKFSTWRKALYQRRSIPFLSERQTWSEGKDVTVVALSRMVYFAMEAAKELAKEGIDVEIIDPRTLYPLDEEAIIQSVEKTGRLVIYDEDTPCCSMATDIAAMVADKGDIWTPDQNGHCTPCPCSI
jgi:pyruvate/2-oxoglutarate/acetoin dehydrogenase E1 component